MIREDEKHRGPEYVPPGPVRIRSTSTVEPVAYSDGRVTGLEVRIAALESALAKAILQCGVHGAQIASLQMSMPKGIDHP
jgi:hypothetical protein